MQPKEHIAYGGAVAAALTPMVGEKAALFFLASVLIDVDHYIDYLYFARFKDWSLRGMFRFHAQLSQWKHRSDFLVLEAFHTAEFLAALGLVALYFRSLELGLVLAGMLFHLGLDLVRLAQWRRVRLRALCFVEYWLRKRSMLARGVHPEALCEEAYLAVADRGGLPRYRSKAAVIKPFPSFQP